MSLTDDLSDAFFQGLLDMTDRLQINPTDMLGVMMAESNVKANAQNASSDASGLIQFLPSTLKHLGWTGAPKSFRQLSAAQQVPYVEAHFQPYAPQGLGSAARVYQVVFLPSSLKLGSSSGTVIVKKGGINSAVYDGNRGLDTDFNGTITVGELQKAIERKYNSARWQEIMQRLAGFISDSDGSSDNVDAIDLRTQTGVFDALEALGFDRQSYTYTTAVRAFQRRSGLTADGVVGPRTRTALIDALDENGIPYVL